MKSFDDFIAEAPKTAKCVSCKIKHPYDGMHKCNGCDDLCCLDCLTPIDGDLYCENCAEDAEDEEDEDY